MTSYTASDKTPHPIFPSERGRLWGAKDFKKWSETMGEKKVTKKPQATKSKTKDTEKKAPAKKADIKRNSKGQFIKGESGNPGGRPKLSEDFENYAKLAPGELWKIVEDKETSRTLKASILEWFSEMFYGKARQQVDLEADSTIKGVTEVRFEGELDKWAQ